MSDPICTVRISLYNKKLYDFLYRYAVNGAFPKERLVITAETFSKSYPIENITSLCEEINDMNHIYITDLYGGHTSHVPEGIYDVIPCFLIYISSMFRWNRDVFLDFKASILKEKSELQMYFDKVSWEAEWTDNRYSWDGIYKWKERFIYDRFTDQSEHIKRTYKEGLDLERYMGDDICDGPEKQRYKNAIMKRSKYHDYNWNDL